MTYFWTIVAILDISKGYISAVWWATGLNSQLELITPKSITGTYFDTNLTGFSLVGLSMETIFDYQMFISHLFF